MSRILSKPLCCKKARLLFGASALTTACVLAFSFRNRPFKSAYDNLPTEYPHKLYSNSQPVATQEIPSRIDCLSRLKSGETFDVLIIGGGCTGSGAALDAASRGLKVALIEKNDFSSGTSSRSTKLIHGGVRYLEKAFKNLDVGQLNLVKDALEERRHLMDISPNLSHEIPIIVPLYYKFPEILFYAPYFYAGMKMYDFFAGSKGGLKSSFFMGKREVMEKFPMLNQSGLKGAIVYYDGMHNDARMNLGIALTAANKGAAVTNHVEAKKLLKDYKGKICGAVLEDKITGDVFNVRTKAVINATGCFSDGVRRMDDRSAKPVIQPSAGVHVVLPPHYSPEQFGMLIPNTDDNRVLFLLPWENSTIAGTTDSSCEIKNRPAPTAKEVSFVMRELKKYLNSDLSSEDINASWSGIRPLAKTNADSDTASISRDHVIEVSGSGLITISGGKWTTYRKMAEDVIDRLLKENAHIAPKTTRSSTRGIPLVGAAGWSLALKNQLVIKGYPADVAEHLSHNYGFFAYDVADLGLALGMDKRLSPGYPFIEAEVLFGVRHEHAMRVVDVIARRMRLAFLNETEARNALPRVLEIMAREKRWSAKKRVEEFLDASLFLDTMSVTSKKRHDWQKTTTPAECVGKLQRTFGESSVSESDARSILGGFQDQNCLITPQEFVERVKEISLSKSAIRNYLPRLEKLAKSRGRQSLSPEEYLFLLSAAMIQGK